jgi:hypothetical protein
MYEIRVAVRNTVIYGINRFLSHGTSCSEVSTAFCRTSTKKYSLAYTFSRFLCILCTGTSAAPHKPAHCTGTVPPRLHATPLISSETSNVLVFTFFL